MRIYTMILWVVLGISWHRYHQIYDLQDKHARTLLIVCKLFPLIMNAFQMIWLRLSRFLRKIFIELMSVVCAFVGSCYTFTLHFSIVWRFFNCCQLSRRVINFNYFMLIIVYLVLVVRIVFAHFTVSFIVLHAMRDKSASFKTE